MQVLGKFIVILSSFIIFTPFFILIFPIIHRFNELTMCMYYCLCKVYMIHGDVTYTDEALYENKLSVVYEDLKLARERLDNIREFISITLSFSVYTYTFRI